MRRLLLVLGLLLVVGCGSGAKKVPLPLDQVPEVVLQAAQKQYPNVKFSRAMREPDGNYELVGKNERGKTIEADFTPAGVFVRED